MMLLKRWIVVMIGVLALAPITFAKGQDRAKKEEDRIANSSTVMAEFSMSPTTFRGTYSTRRVASS